MTPDEAHLQSAIDTADRVLSGRDGRETFGRHLLVAIRDATIQQPLHALAVSFLLGVIVATRRR